MRRCVWFLVACLFWFAASAFGQANGKLQIHFMDVGQGDGAVLISPSGEIVLFDDGLRNNCDKPVSYLQQLGIDHVDYLIVSHYHADHIGCTPQVLQDFPLRKEAIDRGFDYPGQTYQNYVAAVGTQRTSLTAPGRKVTLDAGSANPVTIEIVALNGNGIATSNENDLSLVAVVAFGQFRAEFGGDLSGASVVRQLGPNPVEYKDIESSVSTKVGHIHVYKVHHHCSAYSSNDAWLSTTQPIIGIVSAGDGNTYGHPDPTCLERLHKAGVKTYWTENGNGGTPESGLDVVGGNITVEVAPTAQSFTVTYAAARVDTYTLTGANGTPGSTPTTSTTLRYAWSKNSSVYHFANCRYVQNISPANLEQGSTPPPRKTLHNGCPK